jgi:hypothetical protein
MATPDLQFSNPGPFAIVMPMTDMGRDWLLENIGDPDKSDDGYSDVIDYGGGIVIEHRYLADIVLGARADGLTCEG